MHTLSIFKYFLYFILASVWRDVFLSTSTSDKLPDYTMKEKEFYEQYTMMCFHFVFIAH